eukprot:1613141-Heterocapsa_arctica.AAC.1
MGFTGDIPGSPSSGDLLLGVVRAGFRNFLVLDVVPGFVLEGREHVGFRHRKPHDFLHHRVSLKTGPDRA